MLRKKNKINLKIILGLLILIFSLVTTFVSAEDTSEKPEKKQIDLEDGYYKIPIKLWHAIEEKPSMGNKALIQTAELEVEDKEANLYMGSDKMEYMSITASLINIYFQKEDGKYYAAEPGCFEIEVPKEKDKRPRVFKTSLINMDEMTKVYVDPKVEPMGDEPIRARIKLEFDKAEKIDEKDAELINKFKNGPAKKEFTKEDSGEVENKNLIVKYDPNTFNEEFSFYGNKLSGKDAEEYSKNFEKLDQVNVFKIEFLGPLKEITGNEESIQGTRKKIEPLKEITLKLPLLKFSKDDNLVLYDMTNGEKKKLDFTVNDDHLETKVNKTGIYVVVKAQEANSANEPKTDVQNTTMNNNLPQNKDSSKNQRAKAFMASVKKPQAKAIGPKSKTSGQVSVQAPNTQPMNTKVKIESPLQKQMELAKSAGGNSDKDKETQAEEIKEVKEKESAGLITFIVLLFILINALAAIFIKKNFKSIKDMKEEIIFLGGLKENEK